MKRELKIKAFVEGEFGRIGCLLQVVYQKHQNIIPQKVLRNVKLRSTFLLFILRIFGSLSTSVGRDPFLWLLAAVKTTHLRVVMIWLKIYSG